jgi:hypothetical protein
MLIEIHTFWPFCVGFIIGWLIEWVIDWVYWRRRTVPRSEYTTLQAIVTERTSERDMARALVDRHAQEIADLQQHLITANEQIARHEHTIGSLKSSNTPIPHAQDAADQRATNVQ